MGDYIQIKRSYFVIILVLAVAFAAGFFVSRMGTTGKFTGGVTTVENCKNFCPLLNAEYAYVQDDYCYCNQKQYVYNQQRNETTTVIQTVKAGIIKSFEKTPGLSDEARSILIQQLQQQQLQQQNK